MLANPDAERIALDGANGVLVVDTETKEGHLVVFGLEEAPDAHTYEAWVIEEGEAVPAGLFSGGAEGDRRSARRPGSRGRGRRRHDRASGRRRAVAAAAGDHEPARRLNRGGRGARR